MHKRLVYRSNSKLHMISMNLAGKLRTYKTCNSTVGFSKYKFNKKLLNDVTLLRVMGLSYTWCNFK